MDRQPESPAAPPPDFDFLLVGTTGTRGRVYLRHSGAEHNVWTSYDLRPGGALANPRVVFGQGAAGWRGLPESLR